MNDSLKIDINSQKQGTQRIETRLEDAFFADFEQSEISAACLDVIVEADKKQDTIAFNISINGWASVPCDRCLDPVQVDITINPRVYLLLDEEAQTGFDEDDDVIFITPSEREFDVAPIIYQYAHLALPIRRTHEPHKCNPEMEKYLAEVTIN